MNVIPRSLSRKYPNAHPWVILVLWLAVMGIGITYFATREEVSGYAIGAFMVLFLLVTVAGCGAIMDVRNRRRVRHAQKQTRMVQVNPRSWGSSSLSPGTPATSLTSPKPVSLIDVQIDRVDSSTQTTPRNGSSVPPMAPAAPDQPSRLDELV